MRAKPQREDKHTLEMWLFVLYQAGMSPHKWKIFKKQRSNNVFGVKRRPKKT